MVRESSLHPSRSGLDNSQEDLRSEKSSNRTSKAQKVLGTADIPIPQNNNPTLRDDASSTKRRTQRPSFLRPGGFVLFPTSNSQEQQQPPPHLRLRASSPLIAHGPQSKMNDTTTGSKKMHHSGSGNALFSHFNSRESTLGSQSSPAEQQGQPEPSSVSLHSKGSSKRKLRPRIDLSLLFPKPKPSNSNLLSPQRMTHSPSPVSAVGDFSKSDNREARPAGRRYTSTQSPTQQDPTTVAMATEGLPPPDVRRPVSNRSAPADRTSKISTDTRNTDWLESPLHRTVRTSEMDMALQNYTDHQRKQQQQQEKRQQLEKSTGRARADADFSMHSSKCLDQLNSRQYQVNTPHGSTGGWSKETYLSPKSQPCQPRRRPSPLPENDDRVEKESSMSKKSNGSTLANSDLNTSSVLCLSSSDDEDTDHDGPARNPRTGRVRRMRDSVTTYDELEPEICTASAAQATRGPAVRRLDLRQVNPVRGQCTMLKSPSINRNPSMSSAGRSSYGGQRTTSRRSSGIPTITEPDILTSDHFPMPGGRPQRNNTVNRRSRVIAVTRQEENLLEAMRQRKGKVTPSLFNESRLSQATNASSVPPLPIHNPAGADTDRASIAPSRDSLYSTDMSFLRLSASVPSYTTSATARTDQGAARMDKDGSPSQGASSDIEQKTVNSTAPSPRASLVYSESLPSPSTSATSPLTPTLPIHRFSTVSNQHPPSQPLPAVPSHDQRRHSRHRTDSSEAIVLREATPEETKDNEDFPIWAYGWNNEQLTAVH